MLRNILKPVMIALSVVLLTACSGKLPPSDTSEKSIQPIISFDGRLLVMQPTRRWQVLIHWQANLRSGYARLTHAATGRIIKLRWQGDTIHLLDNQTKSSQWQSITAKKIMQYGIVLPPQTLAKILHHQVPTALKYQGANIWKGQLNGSSIRLRWQDHMRKLTLTDITHGRTAILYIQP